MSAVPALIELLNKSKSKEDTEREALLPNDQAAVLSSATGVGKPSTDSGANTPSSARAEAGHVILGFAFNTLRDPGAQASTNQAGTYGASAAIVGSDAAAADVKVAAEPRPAASTASVAASAPIPISHEELIRRLQIEKKEELDCFKLRAVKDVSRFGDFNECRLALEAIHRNEIAAQASVEKTFTIEIPTANITFATSVHMISNRLLGTYLGIRKRVAELQLKQRNLLIGEETLESLIGFPPNYRELHYHELTEEERKQLTDCLAKSILDGIEIMRNCNKISREEPPESHAEYVASLSRGNEVLPNNNFNPNDIELVRRQTIPNQAEHNDFFKQCAAWACGTTEHPLKVFAHIGKEILDRKKPPSSLQMLTRRLTGR
jgi:hypothetical protein